MSKVAENPPAMNGTSHCERKERIPIVCLDRDDPAYIKEMQRPAAIKEDLSEMERRKRVQQLLDSKEFCRELEQLVQQDSAVDSADLEQLKTFQRIPELALSRSQMSGVNLHNTIMSNLSSVVPIADLRGNEPYSKEERIARNKLASLYRLVDCFQWSQGIYNHITLRLPGDDPCEILINPFGLLYHEITASSLVKISLDGDILDGGTTKLGINRAGYVLHSAIHGARHDVKCVLHMHTAIVSAVSSMKCGLLPICQEAMIIGPVAYHDYQGIVSDEEERTSIVRDLGDKNVMLLRNHGFVACGESIEDALHLAFHTVIACETQIRAAKAGIENLVIPDSAAVAKAYEVARHGGGGVNKTTENGDAAPSWRIGELEWEAWMRVLDCAGHNTGHIYRQPYLKSRHQSRHSSVNRNDVAQPPAASAHGTVDETDTGAMAAYRLALLRKEQEKQKWLNSPNNYQKVHIYESGTDNPKVITKWVQDMSKSQNGTPVKINAVNQFSLYGTNPREFKDKQKEMKELRRAGVTNAGPQSSVLDMPRDDSLGYESAGSPYRDAVIIGTASKGIIDRQYQHNAQVYRSLYAPNPFSNETDEDIHRYLREVENKSRSASAMEQRTASKQYTMPESPTPDTASLMQAVRHGRPIKSASMDDELENVAVGVTPKVTAGYNLVTTFDEATDRCSTTLVERNVHEAVPAQRPREPQLEPSRPLLINILPPSNPPCRPTSLLMTDFDRQALTSRIDAPSLHNSVTEPAGINGKDGKKKKRKGFFSFVRKK